MRLAGRSVVISAVLFCVGVAAACTSARQPSFEEAARRLTADTDTLLAASTLTVSPAHRSDETEDRSCLPGQVRRLVQAEGEAAGAPDGVLLALQDMGYDQIVDDLDLRDESTGVFIVRNPETNLTFELTVLDGPNVRIVGRTTCYTPANESTAP
ncbi:hypothetical protein [Nonomuraea sp. WAC 01424]|uniref:hypothetical protein n=1 Tax=Nonomuraea sp. WAC 01424 TaxID=2203200 RepID=UPI000F792E5A|nr:hypothetical protein [Nonomuraea sp. WAC 01424]